MNKIKLSFPAKEEYKWIYNSKATICTMKCRINVFIDNPEYIIKLSRLFPNVSNNLIQGLTFEVSGVAKCHDNDEFDQITGEHIAESKAKAKAYSIAHRYVSTYKELVEEEIDKLIDFENESTHQYLHELDHIEYLTDIHAGS